MTTINEMDAIEQSQSVDMADTTSVDGSHYYSSNSSSELTGTEREAAASSAYSNTESIKARWIDPVNIQITALRLKLDWWWVGGLHGGKFTAHAWAWDPNVAGIHFDQTHIGPFLWHDYENADTFMKLGVKVNFYNKTFANIVAQLLGKPGWIVCGSYKSPRADFSHDLMLAGGAGGWAADKAINKKSGACTNLVHQKTTDTFSPSSYPAS